MSNQPFTLSQVRPIREAMTVSRPAHLGQEVPVTWFSLGAGTSITPESYDCTTLYLGGEGSGTFVLGNDGRAVAPGNAILTALEGKAIIGYEGKDYELNAGESFRFDKNGLHSVTPQGKFKMSLLLVIE